MPNLYKLADCFVFATRGEGLVSQEMNILIWLTWFSWGRPPHEAMLMERPTIVTNWSGPTG